MLHRTSDAVRGPDQDHIEAAAAAIAHHFIETRTFDLGAADPVGILVDDLIAPLGSHLAQVIELGFGVLIEGGHSHIEGGALHWQETSISYISEICKETAYNYLPGVIVNTLDGGLTARFAPQDDPILVIGTAGKGVINTLYQVTDRAVAAGEFGFSGSLERGIEECATNSDNIQAFRIGATPMKLTGVGLDTTTSAATPSFDIIFNDVTADAATRYQIWYKSGVLSVWKDGTLEYSKGLRPSGRRNRKSPRAPGPSPDIPAPICTPNIHALRSSVLPHYSSVRVPQPASNFPWAKP